MIPFAVEGRSRKGDGRVAPAAARRAYTGPMRTLLATLLLSLAAAASAQDAAPFGPQCGSDAQAVCPGLSKGELVSCLMKDPSRLSSECRALVEPVAPCVDAISSACAEVQPGGGAIHRCLRKHWDDLSGKCRSSVTAQEKQAEDTGFGPGSTKRR